MSNPNGRPQKYKGDPILRMRAYVRQSIKEKIELAARLQKKTTGQIIDHQFEGPLTRDKRTDKGPENKRGEKFEI